MNRIMLIGRLTRDPDYRTGNTNVVRFTLACDRIGEGADYPSCKAFGKTADFVNKYFKKGMRVAVEGHIQTGSYEDRDGRTVYTTDVICDRVEFADGKDVPTSPRDGVSVRGRTNPEAQRQKPAQGTLDGFLSIPEGIDDELPFE